MPTLLFLCHANIARSPAAELLARARLGVDSGLHVRSAGTHARQGHRIDAHIGESLRRRGIVAADHRSAPATTAMLADARMILTFEAVQRSWVLREMPGAVRRTFTIRRAAALLADHGPEGLAGDAAAYTAVDDFADPYGLGPHAAETAVAEIAQLLAAILPALESSAPETDALAALRSRARMLDGVAESSL